MKTTLAYIVNSRCTESGTFEVQHGYSSIAQLAEHSTVNRRVTGSSPVGGADYIPPSIALSGIFRMHHTALNSDRVPKVGVKHNGDRKRGLANQD